MNLFKLIIQSWQASWFQSKATLTNLFQRVKSIIIRVIRFIQYVIVCVFNVTVFKKLLRWGVGLLMLVSMVIVGCNFWIEQQTRGRLYSNLQTIPAKKVALVLGTVKRLSNGRLNRYFLYRIQAAARLYQAGKVKHIIVSGDNRSKYYNEPLDMQKALIAQGVPAEAITLDYAGLRTLDSVVRAQKIFAQDDFIIVSQAFHNQRALFICDFYKIQAIGFNAEAVPLWEDMKTPMREYFARFKAVLDLYMLRTQPRFLGEQVEIPV